MEREESDVANKGRKFEDGTRGSLLRKVILASNDSSRRFTKLSVDICIFLASRGGRKVLSSLFYKDLQTLAEKVAKYSGRTKVPTKGAMSLALKSISEAGLYTYEIETPHNKSKHGDKRGVKLTLID